MHSSQFTALAQAADYCLGVVIQAMVPANEAAVCMKPADGVVPAFHVVGYDEDKDTLAHGHKAYYYGLATCREVAHGVEWAFCQSHYRLPKWKAYALLKADLVALLEEAETMVFVA